MIKLLKSADFLSFLVNAIFFGVFLFVGTLEYGGADDYFLAAVLEGGFGDGYNPHLYFVNTLYGALLIPLYSLIPSVSWYYVGELFAVFISLTVLGSLLVRLVGVKWGVVLTALLSAACSPIFYFQVQFTQCASILTAAGGASLIAYGLKPRKKSLLIVVFLILWGSFMRWEAFLMGLPFLAAAALVSIKDFNIGWKRAFVILSSIFFLIVGTHYIDKALYDNDRYRTYKEFQGPRAILGDSRNYEKTAVYNALEKEGVSGKDFYMAASWKFYDTQVFSVENMKKMAGYVKAYSYSFDLKKVSSKLVRALRLSMGHPICWIFFIFCLVVLISNPKRGLYPWLALFFIAIMVGYLISIERLVLRVECGFWIYGTALAIPLMGALKPLPQKIFVVAISLVFLSSVVFAPNSDSEKQREQYKQVSKYIEQHSQYVFLFSLPQYMSYARYAKPAYKSVEVGGLKNCISLGYWNQYLPEITEHLNKMGVQNPIRDVVQDNVIVVGDATLGDFLQRHYYDSIKVDTLDKIGNSIFYKYRLETAK